ncbi:MAG TPA: FAD-binding oxidoreductase [Candidatus Sulfopaludibacter sp.]|jgi:FAD/FMN-containing dehydrogenase|nr:FAD-binding oxidoreductase [Candidatus Sulfopaludibacter sp.]
MLTPESIAAFRGQFRGEIIEPEDARYDDARKVYNGMIDRKPRLIAQCTDVADVMAAIRFARETGVKVSIRGGGHNAGGLGVCDDGLVIDLAPIRYVHVDPSARTVRVGGGNKWADVDHAAHAFGLAVPSGIVSSTGVGGLTLGGGLGHLTRKYGLTIDNLLSADVVLADGTFVVASADENPDLFWALRGGGGNFGVVTSFLFQAHPVHTVCAGPMLWELDQTEDVLKWYREFIVQAPEEINGFFAFLTVPPGPPFPEALHFKKMCGIVWCYPGTMEQANAILEPIRSYRPPAFEFFVPMPFPMLQGMFDGLYPPGLQWYWKADFFKELSDEAVARHFEHGSKLPTLHSSMHIYPVNGAAHKVGPNETAWSYRDAQWSQVIVGVDPDPANREAITDWAKAYYDALHPYGAGGAYVNFMMEEGEDRIRATYRDNYERLAAVKAKYDPENFFRVNQNIKPGASTGAGA